MLNTYSFKSLIQLSKVVFLLFFSVGLTTAYSAESDKTKITENENIKTVSVPVFSKETNKDFDDIIEDLLVVIGEHNFRLNQHAKIGNAISIREKTPYPNATVLHFCNLGYAKELLDLAPDYLLRMPCRISIWQNKDKSSLIEVWLLPEDDKRTIEFSKKINNILKEIVTYGAS